MNDGRGTAGGLLPGQSGHPASAFPRGTDPLAGYRTGGRRHWLRQNLALLLRKYGKSPISRSGGSETLRFSW